MTTDPGFAPIFHGWNVWDVFAKNDLDTEIGGIGVSPDRRLRIWVDQSIRDGAPAAEVADPANPLTLVGGTIELIENAGGLQAALRKESVPGPAILLDGPATVHTVRFFNRGPETALSWPHTDNFLLDAVYQPTTASPITNAPEPGTLAGAANAAGAAAAKTTKTVVTIVAVVAGGAALIWVLSQLNKGRRRYA
jgi:hypothetical protein